MNREDDCFLRTPWVEMIKASPKRPPQFNINDIYTKKLLKVSHLFVLIHKLEYHNEYVRLELKDKSGIIDAYFDKETTEKYATLLDVGAGIQLSHVSIFSTSRPNVRIYLNIIPTNISAFFSVDHGLQYINQASSTFIRAIGQNDARLTEEIKILQVQRTQKALECNPPASHSMKIPESIDIGTQAPAAEIDEIFEEEDFW